MEKTQAKKKPLERSPGMRPPLEGPKSKTDHRVSPLTTRGQLLPFRTLQDPNEGAFRGSFVRTHHSYAYTSFVHTATVRTTVGDGRCMGDRIALYAVRGGGRRRRPRRHVLALAGGGGDAGEAECLQVPAERKVPEREN